MIDRIRISKKDPLRTILLAVEDNARSRTGRNIRRMMITEEEPYQVMNPGDEWKVDYILLLLDERDNRGLSKEEQEWLNFLCCGPP